MYGGKKMVNWKEHGKDALKAGSIVGLTAIAWNQLPEARDSLIDYVHKLERCGLGDWSASGLKFTAESLKYVGSALTAYLTQKIAKKL
jgi:hypothetical protein